MKKFLALILIFAAFSNPAHSEENYDPQHTMLALNMAIVSVHKIVTTKDRIVLDQEYNNIINKLALGNIESDYELTGLYTELMNFITGKALRQEEAKRFQERYNKREQRQLIDSLSGIRAYGGNLWSWLRSLATSCVSSYFSYQTSKAELLEGLDDELWQLKKEDIEDCNDLQVRLLNSSWNLLRQYKLPDEYRLTQDSLNGFFKAVNEPDPEKRLRMLKARNVEKNFQVYPPYWFYRARAAQEAKDDSEALRCFDKFEEIWRPVLRNDPYKLEYEKFRVQKLAEKSEIKKDEIKKHLEIVLDYIPEGDWSNNLFAGIAYSLIGDKDEGIACVEPNIDFGYEENVSGAILAEIKKGELDAFTLFALQNDLNKAIENPTPKKAEVQQPETKTEVKRTSGKRRDLTKTEIMGIARQYGLEIIGGRTPNDDEQNWYSLDHDELKYQEIYAKRHWSYLPPVYYVAVLSKGVKTRRADWTVGYGSYITYDELRNDPKYTFPYLEEELYFMDSHCSEMVLMLMELKELE